MAHAKIAACLPVRNAAQTLPRLLASIRTYVDEVCILDTGSTDGTLELLEQAASEPGAPIRVEQAEWRDDYAWARNVTFEMASSDYCVWFDDDEILEGGARLRAILEASDSDVLYVRRVEVYERVTDWFGTRLARREMGEWKRRVHEELHVPCDATAAVVSPAKVRVLHHPHSARSRHDYQQITEKAIADEPSRKLLGVLAIVLGKAGDYQGAAALFERALDPDDPLPAVPETGPMFDTFDGGAWQYLAATRALLRDLDGAVEARTQARLIARLNRLNPLNAAADDYSLRHPVQPHDPSIRALRDSGILNTTGDAMTHMAGRGGVTTEQEPLRLTHARSFRTGACTNVGFPGVVAGGG